MSATPVASLAEIAAVMNELPGPDLAAGAAADAGTAVLPGPPGALGRLAELRRWLCLWQGRHPPRLDRPRVAVFAGGHGVAGRDAAAGTRERAADVIAGRAAVNRLCRSADADLRLYEMDLDRPSADFTAAAAMAEADCARALAYGMLAVEPGLDLLCLGETGSGSETSAAALCCGLFGGPAADWIADAHAIAAVDAAMALHRRPAADPFDVLARLGGPALAAIAGAVVAARLARTPVLLDGFAGSAAAAVLHAVDPRALDHCRIADLAPGPGHRRLAERLGQHPLLDFGLRTGEGIGATLAIPLLKAAVDCEEL